MRLILILMASLLFSSLKAQDARITNKHFWHSNETKSPPERIWEIWTDVPNWKNWDTGLKDAKMTGNFELNAKGEILSLDERKAKFEIVEFSEGHSYTYKTKLPLGALYVKRFLKSENGITTFTHEVWFSGFSGGLFAKILGKDFKEMLPEVLQNIKKIAEEDVVH